MARVSPSDVKDILDPGGDYNGTSDLNPFIRSATNLIDRVVTCASKKGVNLTADEQAVLEMWSAAHLYCCSDQQYQNERTSGAGANYWGKGGMNFQSTKYGQTALSLDPSGCLASITSNKRLQVIWLGKKPSEQIPAEDRGGS